MTLPDLWVDSYPRQDEPLKAFLKHILSVLRQQNGIHEANSPENGNAPSLQSTPDWGHQWQQSWPANLCPMLTASETSRLYESARIYNNVNKQDAILLGEHTHVRGELTTFAHGGRITIGDSCFIGEGTRIWSAKSIRIGNHVLISHNVNIYDCDTHPIDSPFARRRQFHAIITAGHPTELDLQEQPVVIEDDALISSQCIILKGVTIGRAAVVGAGAVVTKDVPPGVVVAGNPARFVRKLLIPEGQS